jgi:galactoside O-acetyltransferase
MIIRWKGLDMTEREKMNAGIIYDPGDKEIVEEQVQCQEKLYDYNMTRPSEGEKRTQLLKKMFGSIGEGCYIEPPLRANWGGRHVYMGDYVYANYNLTMVDDGNIYIGNKVMFGPNVTLATANHPVDPSLRERMLQYNKDIHIGNNVWIGSGVIIVPGITIGDNSVIGAGSVVTKDIPAGVVAYGNPCKVIREIGEHDREYFYKDEKIDWSLLQ